MKENEKELLQDKIDDYLLDRMSDEERLTFEKEVAENTALRDQLEYTRKLQAAMKSRNEKLNAMQEWEEDYAREQGQQAAAAHPSRRRLLYWVSGVAAVFIAGILVLRMTAPNQTVDPSLGNIESDFGGKRQSAGVSSGSGGTHRGGGEYATIYSAIQHQNYEVACILIDRELEETQLEARRLTHSSSTVSDDNKNINDEDREEYLLQIKEAQDELKWLKVQALVGLGEKDEAIELLDELRNTEGEYQHLADSMYNEVSRK